MAKKYQVLKHNAPIRGLYTTIPENQLSHDFTPDCLNVLIEDNRIKKREGYAARITGISGITSKRIMEGGQYGDASGDLHMYLLTTDKFMEVSAFPVTSVLDNFNRANAGTLGANWSILNNLTDDGGIISNQAYNDTIADICQMYWNATSFSADQEAYITMATLATNESVGVFLRLKDVGGATFDGYRITYNVTTTTVNIQRVDNGSYTTLFSKSVAGVVNGDKIGARVVGNTIGAWMDIAGAGWGLIGTASDSTYTAGGFIGMDLADEAGTRLDDFGGGNTSGGFVTDLTGGSLTATVDNPVFAYPVGGLSLDNLYITNGVDPIKVWTGTGNIANLTLASGFTTLLANCLIGFKGHLVLGDVTEDGSAFPYRIRWSQSGDPTNWDDATIASAGFVNLVEDENNSKVQCMYPIRDALAIYKENSVYLATYEGDPNYFVPRMRIANRGAISRKAVCPVLDGNAHLVVSNDNIFIFDGFNFAVPPIGDRIKTTFFNNLNRSKKHQVFCKAFPDRFEAWIMYPAGAATNPDSILVWNWLSDSWTQITYADDHNCFIYQDSFDNPAIPFKYIGGSAEVYAIQNGDSDDNTVAINGYFRTKLHDYEEFGIENLQKTVESVELDYTGTDPTVQIGSTNGILNAIDYATAVTVTDKVHTPDNIKRYNQRKSGTYLAMKIADNSTSAAFEVATYRIYVEVLTQER